MTFEVLAVFDFDGDGRSELAAALDESYDETGDRSTQLVTPVDGVLVPYAPAADFSGAIVTVRDVDADGRPDFVSLVPWVEGGFGYSESSAGRAEYPPSRAARRTFANDDGRPRLHPRGLRRRAGDGTLVLPSTGDPDAWPSSTTPEQSPFATSLVWRCSRAPMRRGRLIVPRGTALCTFDSGSASGDALRARVRLPHGERRERGEVVKW
jgi:hypothetical protein